MNYTAIWRLIDASPNITADERNFLTEFLKAAQTADDPYLEQPRMGVKASALAWIVRQSEAGLEALVHYHAKSGNYWPFGGGFEAQDEADPIKCALRELAEESGLSDDIIARLQPLAPQLLCLSVIMEQSVAAKKHGWLEFTTAWHWPPTLPARPGDLWMPLDKLRAQYTHDPFYVRMIDCTLALEF